MFFSVLIYGGVVLFFLCVRMFGFVFCRENGETSGPDMAGMEWTFHN
jgi:hypothetical protein